MATELRAIPTTSWDTWYQTELCEAFPPNERKPLATMLELAAEGRYELLGLFDGADLLGYATLWTAPERPDYVMLDYLGVTAARRNGGLGGSILAALAYTVLPVWSFIMDGGGFYILIGIALYLLRSRRGLQAAVYAALTMLFYFIIPYLQLSSLPDFQFSQMFTLAYEWFGVLSVIPMLLYNGTRGRGMKTLFYVFYPAHLALLGAIYCILHPGFLAALF